MCTCRPTTVMPEPPGSGQHAVQLLVPDAVLGAFAAGVGLLAVPVAEAGVDPQRDRLAAAALGQLLEHIGRAAVDVDAVLGHQLQGIAVENIGRIHERRRITLRRVAGRHGPQDFAGAHGIDHHAQTAEQVEDGQVRAGLLSVADVLERSQIGHALANPGGVVDVNGRAVLPGDVGNGDPADFSAKRGIRSGGRHELEVAEGRRSIRSNWGNILGHEEHQEHEVSGSARLSALGVLCGYMDSTERRVWRRWFAL